MVVLAVIAPSLHPVQPLNPNSRRAPNGRALCTWCCAFGAPQVQFLSQLLGLNTSATCNVIVARAPGVLTLSVEKNIEPTVAYLTSALPDVDIQRVLRKAPSLMGYSREKLGTKIGYLKELFPGANVEKLVSAAPTVLTLDMKKNLKRKLRTFQQAMAPQQQGGEAEREAQRVRKVAAASLMRRQRGRPSSSSKAAAILDQALFVNKVDRALEGGLSPLLGRHKTVGVVTQMPALLLVSTKCVPCVGCP